ncbi:hypothetical protein GCM10009790_06570 [Georgenia ruanii]
MLDDMRAVGVTEFGGPESLRIVRLPRPAAGVDEVRIRVRAATVNPTDTLLRSGQGRRRPQGGAPYIPGMEFAGEVDQVGEGSSWRVGDKVMAITLPTGPRGGAYAQHVVVRSRSVAPVPSRLTAVEAATIPMNGLTALLALDKLGLAPGQVVAVTGAAGALGGYVVQLAKARGLTVLADAAARDEQLVRIWAQTMSCSAGTTSRLGSGISSHWGWTDSSTRRCLITGAPKRSGTTAAWQWCVVGTGNQAAASRCIRYGCRTMRRTPRRSGSWCSTLSVAS